MPNVNDLKNSKFLAKEDVEPDVLVTIESYEEVDVSMDDKPTQNKWVLHFREMDKPMVLNKTNGMLIESIIGSGEFDDWVGKKVVLYNDKSVMFAGEFTGGIRVRAIRRQEQPITRAGEKLVDMAAEENAKVEDTRDHSQGNPDDSIPF